MTCLYLLWDEYQSKATKINIYIYLIIKFFKKLYNNNMKLYIDYLTNEYLPKVKSFMMYILPFIKAFIRYNVKKYYNKLILKKCETLYLYKEYWNFCIQLHKITYRHAEVKFFYNVFKVLIMPYLTIISFIIMNYLVLKTSFVYGPMQSLEPDVNFDEVFLAMCKLVEDALAG